MVIPSAVLTVSQGISRQDLSEDDCYGLPAGGKF